MPEPITRLSSHRTSLSRDLYYNSGTVASPTWVEISEIGDLSVPDFANTLAEIKTRASQWDAALPARKKLAVEFSYLYKADTTIWQFLRDMYWNSEIHEFAVADGDIATIGTEALRFAACVENFPIMQNLEEVSMVDTVLDCSPKSDPYGMRVYQPSMGKEDFHERQEAPTGTDHQEVA